MTKRKPIHNQSQMRTPPILSGWGSMGMDPVKYMSYSMLCEQELFNAPPSTNAMCWNYKDNTHHPDVQSDTVHIEAEVKAFVKTFLN